MLKATKMGARKCLVEGCLSCSIRVQDRGVTFHKIPLNEEIKNKWMSECRLNPDLKINKSSNVCSRHFLKADFQDFKGKKYMLKQGVVPSIFPWSSSPTKKSEDDATTASTSEEVQKKEDLNESVSSVVSEGEPKSPVKKPPKTTELSTPESNKKMLKKASEPSASKKFMNSPRKSNQSINFMPGSKIEAQDFSGKWHSARVMEVDTEEREVLIHFEKNTKSKTPAMNDEWISMDSVRLRSIQLNKMPSSKLKFTIGDKCFAKWNDSRKFRATIQKILENDMYEVLFDDGFVKAVKGIHISKLKKSDENISSSTPIKMEAPSTPPVSTPTPPPVSFEMPDLKLLPEIPKDGEWCCHWVNDYPVGEEAYVDVSGGRIYTTKVEDWRLPIGWSKHIYQRVTAYGKMDIILVSASGRKFRSKPDLKQFLEEIGEVFDANVYDFGLHKRRAKELGFCTYTDEYKLSLMPDSLRSGLPPMNKIANPVMINDTVNVGALRVKIVNNLYQCPQEGCLKTFRKENHLQIHIKHYHMELAKGLGEFPNMTDLAYLRTTVDEVETPQKPARKPLTTSSGISSPIAGPSQVIKQEPKLEGNLKPEKEEDVKQSEVTTAIMDDIERNLSEMMGEDMPAETAEEVEANETVDEMEDSIANNSASFSVHDGSESFIIDEMFDPESLIKTHSVSRGPMPKIKLFNKRKRSRSKAGNFYKKKKKQKFGKDPSVPLSVSRENATSFMDAEETRHSFGGASTVDSYAKQYQLSLMQIENNTETSQTTNNSICGNFGDDSVNAVVQSPKYINENGEVIKIVRMRKEEIINCICSFGEEDGLMVQCELCLCWQHGICNGFEKDSQVPDKYICYICKNPQRGRESKRYLHDQDWLYEGKLPVANYHVANPKHSSRFDILKQSHTLAGNLLDLKRFMHSLKVKINIASKKDHPKMYLWSKKWEASPPRGRNGDLASHVPLTSCNVSKMNINDIKEEEMIMDVKKEERESIGHSEQDNINNSILAGAPIPAETPAPAETPIEAIEECKPNIPHIPQPEAPIDASECQGILMEHIQKQQNDAMARLQAIEAQIMALESYDDKSEHLESPNLNSYPKAKNTIHMLLNDLVKLRKISAIHYSVQNY